MMADSVVLEEEIDPNYEPTEEEIIEYAKWLGFDVDGDRDLLYIAKEGLKAPLPPDWKPCQTTDTQEIYYFNFKSGESSWDHPCDNYYKKQYEEAKRKKLHAAREDDVRKQQAKAAVRELVSMQTGAASSLPSPSGFPQQRNPVKAGGDKPSLLSPARASSGGSSLAPLGAPLVPLGPLGSSRDAGETRGRATSRDDTPSARALSSGSAPSPTHRDSFPASKGTTGALPALRKSAGGVLPELHGSSQLPFEKKTSTASITAAKEPVDLLEMESDDLPRTSSASPPLERPGSRAAGAVSTSGDQSAADQARIQHRKDLEELKTQHKLQLAKEEGRCEAELSAVKARLEENKRTHEEQITALKATFSQEWKLLRDQHNAAMANLKKEHERDIDELRAAWKSQESAADQAGRERVAAVSREFALLVEQATSVATLQEEIQQRRLKLEEETNELAKLTSMTEQHRQQHEAALHEAEKRHAQALRDMEARIQDVKAQEEAALATLRADVKHQKDAITSSAAAVDVAPSVADAGVEQRSLLTVEDLRSISGLDFQSVVTTLEHLQSSSSTLDSNAHARLLSVLSALKAASVESFCEKESVETSELAREWLTSLSNAAAHAKSALVAVVEVLHATLDENEELSKQREALEGRFGDMEDVAAEKNAVIHALQHKIADLQAQLQQVSVAKADDAERAFTSANEIARLQSDLQAQRDKIAEAEAEVSALRTANATAAAKCKHLEAENATVQRQAQEYAQQLREAETTLQNTTAQLTSQRMECRTLEAKIQSLETATPSVEIQVELSSVRAQLVASNEHTATLRRERDALMEQHSKLTDQLAASQASVMNLMQQLQILQSAAASTTAMHDATDSASDLSALRSEIQELLSQLRVKQLEQHNNITTQASTTAAAITTTTEASKATASQFEEHKSAHHHHDEDDAEDSSSKDNPKLLLQQEKQRLALLRRCLTRTHTQLATRREKLSRDRQQWKEDARELVNIHATNRMIDEEGTTSTAFTADATIEHRKTLLRKVRNTLNANTEAVNAHIQQLKASEKWLAEHTHKVECLELALMKQHVNSKEDDDDTLLFAWRNRTAWKHPEIAATAAPTTAATIPAAIDAIAVSLMAYQMGMENGDYVKLADAMFCTPFEPSEAQHDWTLSENDSFVSLVDFTTIEPHHASSTAHSKAKVPAEAPAVPIVSAATAPMQYVLVPSHMFTASPDKSSGKHHKGKVHKRFKPSRLLLSPSSDASSSLESASPMPKAPTMPRPQASFMLPIPVTSQYYSEHFKDGITKWVNDRRDMHRRVAEHALWLSSFKTRLSSGGGADQHRSSSLLPASSVINAAVSGGGGESASRLLGVPTFVALDPHPELSVSTP